MGLIGKRQIGRSPTVELIRTRLANQRTIGGVPHPDTIDYQSRILAAGGTITDADFNAVDAFVKGIYADGLRAKILDCSPWAGDQLSAALVKLWYEPGISSTLVNTNFVAADYTRSTGITGANNKSLSTGINPSTIPALLDNTHFGIYSRHNTALAVVWGIAPVSGNRLGHHVKWSDNNAYWDAYNATTERVTANTVNSLGLHIGSRASNTDSRLFIKGSQVGTTNTTARSTALPNATMLLFTASGTTAFDTRSYGGYSIGYGLTPAEAVLYNDRWQTLMTAFGRQV